jgi:hypothetical protein
MGNTAWSAGTLKVTTPNGGDSWSKGKKYTIKWKKGNGGSRVKIELLKSGKVYKTIKKRTNNDGKFRWKIPSSQKTSKNYKIRITSISKSDVSDSSNKVFTIKKKSSTGSSSSTALKVTAPNGGESWKKNSIYTITWNKGAAIDTVKIELWKGSGKSGTLKLTIASETTNDGSYSWAIPGSVATGSKYEIRIERVSGSSGGASDTSNKSFSIEKSSSFKLKSSAFKDGGLIPARYTCDGPGPRPPLTISGIPDGTKELVLFLDDLDGTPTATNTTTDWNHWVVFNIPLVSTIKAYSVPSGSTVGKNDTGDTSYDAICPKGEKEDRDKHTYRYTLYAVDSKTIGGPGSSRTEIKSAIDGKILEQVILEGYHGDN